MILLYLGKGKGKTSACVGQCVRAHGQGLAVAFGQFLKRAGQAGEQAMLSHMLGQAFFAGGIGFFRDEAQRPAQRKAAQRVFEWALGQVRPPAECAKPSMLSMLILDEACNALERGLLLEDEMADLCRVCRKANCHLVLSGRTAPEWLVAEADLVTRMEEVKHPYHMGVAAQKGIEF